MFSSATLFQPLMRFRRYFGRVEFALSSLKATARDSLDLERQTAWLLQAVREAMGTERASLLLLWRESGDVELTGPPAHGRERTRLRVDSPIVRWLESHQAAASWGELVVLPQFRTMNSEETAIFEALGAEVLVPLWEEGTLIGILVVGPKRSGARYRGAEMRLLGRLANQVAPRIERARLYAFEREQAEELRELNERKNDYIMVLTHQLRTPLTAIIAAAGMLGQEVEAPEVRHRLVTAIARGVDSLDRLITELTEYAKMRSGTLELELVERDIGSIIAEICELVRPLIDERRQRLTVDLMPNLPLVVVDWHRVEQILVNLITNAIKFTPERGEITVLAGRQGDQLLLQVKDTGPGIPEARQRWIFEAFSADSEAAATQMGLGLGLAIAKALIELHGGTIWVDSEEGGGSTFAFTLPLRREESLGAMVKRA